MLRYGPSCHSIGIRGYGNPDDGVVIIGIAPGRNEMKAGMPLVGQSGQLLDAVLQAAGWPRSKCYATNLICWFNNEPSVEEVKACAPRLEEELREIKPRLIITLGKLATETLTGIEMGKARGVPIWNEKYNCWVLPTWHPATFLHGFDGAIIDIANDLSKIKTVINWPKDIGEFHFEVCLSADDAQRKLDALCKRDTFIAVDVETDNKNVDEIDIFDDRFLCASVSDGFDTIAVPYEVLKRLQFHQARYTFHNGMFDTQAILRHCDIDLPIVEDTMLMSYALDERQGTHRLKQLVREYVGAGFYEDEIAPYKKKGMSFAPENVLYYYNAADACYTARLAQRLYPMMVEENVERVYRDILIPAANTFKYIQMRGVHVDRQKIYKLGAEWTQRWLNQEEELAAEASDAGYPGRINLNSPKQLGELLFGIFRLPGGVRTASGNYSTKKDILESISDEHPFVNKLMAFRRLDKMISTYIRGIDETIKSDHRVHANVLIHGTETGRLAYKNPPLQTIPKVEVVGEDLGRVREIFTPTDDDHIIVECDYSKSEIWGAYCHSKDPQMLKDLQSGDYHTQVASSVFNKPVSEVTKLERSHAKTVTFGLMYGRGADSLATKTIKCSVREAEQYLRNWWARYPVFEKWVKATKEEVANEGVITSMFGRKRRFLVLRPETAYHAFNEAVNFPIQSLSTDCVLTSIIELYPILLPFDSYILTAIHDSVVCEVHKDYLNEVMHLIQKSMSSPKKPDIPGLPCDFKIGIKSWGEAKEYDIHTCQECGSTENTDFYAEIVGGQIHITVRCNNCPVNNNYV